VVVRGGTPGLEVVGSNPCPRIFYFASYFSRQTPGGHMCQVRVPLVRCQVGTVGGTSMSSRPGGSCMSYATCVGWGRTVGPRCQSARHEIRVYDMWVSAWWVGPLSGRDGGSRCQSSRHKI
jgi:hypothetical protein